MDSARLGQSRLIRTIIDDATSLLKRPLAAPAPANAVDAGTAYPTGPSLNRLIRIDSTRSADGDDGAGGGSFDQAVEGGAADAQDFGRVASEDSEEYSCPQRGAPPS